MMNERIRELLLEAQAATREGKWFAPTAVWAEKFAELIIMECVDCLTPLSRNHSIVGAAQDTIKEHFGVE